MTAICRQIGGFEILFEAEDPSLIPHLQAAQERFLVTPSASTRPNTHSRVCLKAAWTEEHIVPKGAQVFDSGSVWKLYDNGNPCFIFQSDKVGPWPYKCAIFDKDYKQGTVWLYKPYFKERWAADPLEYPLDEILMVQLLAQHGGIDVHAAGVVDSKSRGHLFLGMSGAGKSTMAGLWLSNNRGTVLSDDRMVIRKFDQKLHMYGTPWHGTQALAQARSAPLHALYFLRKDTRASTQRLSKTDFLARLYATSFLPFFDRQSVAKSLDFFEEIYARVPCYELGFAKNTNLVDYILSLDLDLGLDLGPPSRIEEVVSLNRP